MFQRQGGVPATYRLDLSKTVTWLERLGNPQLAYPCIHVAGTNGKGSTCHMLASIFHETGKVVGLHTSPHMLDLRERFRVGGRGRRRAWPPQTHTHTHDGARSGPIVCSWPGEVIRRGARGGL